ncbi:hypothetical protein MTQ16_10970, partial [Corynebacterium bovis]|uniref:DUF7507 domain-containing protein n=1 Tax=Corynebacterium bovis TaxID=36808 RepID=UPI0031394B63
MTNTGNRPVYNVTVADKITTEGDKAVEGITASDEAKAKRLNPGEKVEFTATVKAPAANGTLHTDSAKAQGVPPVLGTPDVPGPADGPKVESKEDPANATTSFTDGLTILKKINGDDANTAPGVTVEPGSDMNVTYEVTNTGNRPVYNVTVADKITTEGDKAVEGITASDEAKAKRLNPGEKVEFTATVKAPAANGTLHTDSAKAQGVPPVLGTPDVPGPADGPKVESKEDPANATTSFTDGLTILKKINGDDANTAPGVTVEPGSDMEVTYEVTNTGNRPVYNVTVADKITTEGDKAVEGIKPSDEAKAKRLNPGEKVEFTATVKAPAANGTLHTDSAKAQGVPPVLGTPDVPGPADGPKVESKEDPANATTSFTDGLTILKKINGDDANTAPGVTVEPGSDMEVTYEVTNTGNRPVYNVTVADKITTEGDKAVEGIKPSDEAKAKRLNPDEKVEFTATVKEDPANATTSFTDGLTILKKINGDDANTAPGVTVEPGSDMEVTYEVTNTGNRPVYNVTVADKITTEGDKAVEGIKPSDEAKAKRLNPGEKVEFTATVKEDPANATTSFTDGLTILKKINGDDANTAPGVTVEPGSDM